MPEFNRRRVLRYGVAAAIVTTSAVSAQGLASAGAPPPDKDPRDFDTSYKGKKIKGEHDKAGKKHRVSINGQKLAVVELELPAGPDSTATVTALISALTHYEPVPLDEGSHRDGLLKLTRKAVDALGDEELSPLAGEEHKHS
jgi:hypothetical protein